MSLSPLAYAYVRSARFVGRYYGPVHRPDIGPGAPHPDGWDL